MDSWSGTSEQWLRINSIQCRYSPSQKTRTSSSVPCLFLSASSRLRLSATCPKTIMKKRGTEIEPPE